jgi:hypothetical protein
VQRAEAEEGELMAIVLRANGTRQHAVPQNGRRFSVEEILTLLRAKWVEVMFLDGCRVLIYEDVKRAVHPNLLRPNDAARKLFDWEPDIVGDVLYTTFNKLPRLLQALGMAEVAYGALILLWRRLTFRKD